ncbi:MAG: GNAT family N-acetyltransferase [Treponema sp.]|nr:GNAT family N-acetyltransferase [Treponema sp.]
MYFKKLVGTKCYLSPINENDAEKFTKWLNNLEMTQYLSALFTKSINVQSERAILERLAKEHNYSIIDIKTNELLGNCGFVNLDHINQTSDVGIFIGNKDYWGKGYGTEALSLLVDFGFRVLNLHCISLIVISFNKRAIRSYEKIGFKIIGKKRESVLMGKDRHDMVYMDILFDEFYAKRK